MKFVYYFFIILIIVSCTSSPIEQAIISHEQNFGGTTTDLNMKITSLTHVADFTAADSLAILLPAFEEKRQNKIQSLHNSIADGLISPEIAQQAITAFESDCSGTFLESDYNTISRLKSYSDSVLYSVYNCEYSIHNPLLDAKQTISKSYQISPAGKILFDGKALN